MRDPRNRNHRPHRTSSTTWASNSVRRGHDRLGYTEPAMLHQDHRSFPVLTRDLSEGGAFVTTLNPPDVGDQVQLMLYNGGQNYLCVDAIIRWQDVDKDLTPLGCGVEFVDLSEEQRQELRELLAAREVRMLQTGT